MHLLFSDILYLAIFVIFIQNGESTSIIVHRQNLRKDLLKDYQKLVLPKSTTNNSVQLYIHPRIFSFWLNDAEQKFSFNAIFFMEWTDERLIYDPSKYGNLNRIHFGDGELWKPDLVMVDTGMGSSIDQYGNAAPIVLPNGTVLWFPPCHFEIICDVDLKYWPFDVQHCFSRYGAWTADGMQLELNIFLNNTHIPTTHKSSNGWKIVNATQLKQSYRRITYITHELYIQRECPTFSVLIIVPAVCIPLILMIQFILPVNHPHRIKIGYLAGLLCFCEILFLKMILPRLGRSVPLVVSYFSMCFVIILIAICLSAIYGRLSDSNVKFRPPEKLIDFAVRFVAPVTFFKDLASKIKEAVSTETNDVFSENEKEYSKLIPNAEWNFICNITDRISCVIFAIIFLAKIWADLS